MSNLSRRTFVNSLLAAGAATAVSPLAAQAAGEVDVIIVGAGAAGIAAARRVAAANKRYALLEASDRLGGRCAVDTKIFGVPFDLGAHWIHSLDTNPVAKLASCFDIYPAPRAQTLRVGARPARDSELEGFLAATLRSHRGMTDLGKAKADFPASRLLPKDMFDWQSTVEFILGPFAVGKSLNDVSAFDLARAVERDNGAFCRQGYGALLAKLGTGFGAQLSMPVEAVLWGNKFAVDTPKGNFVGKAIIITVSTGVLTSDKIEFIPPLPKRHLDAAAKLAPGSYDHIALEMPGNPLGLQKDDMVFERADGTKTAALLANVSGTDLHLVEVAGAFGQELSAQGEDAMKAFAADWLASLFGNNVRRAIKRTHATRWNANPLAFGAMSVAGPGNADARKILMEPVGGKVFFAGEAVHETQWGTVNGAWESGTRAAEAALRRLGVTTDGGEDKPARNNNKRKRRR